MTLGTRIASLRKELGLTQENLANRLGVTNQAVSKWESNQCCPDVTLLPPLADLFGISLDALFGREPLSQNLPDTSRQTITVKDLPWPDDGTLRVVLYQGHRLLKNTPDCQDLTFRYEGPALNVISQISISCGDVQGNADAGAGINCGNVEGNVEAGSHVNCGNVMGDVDAGADVRCEAVGGNVDAGCHVECGDVGGDVDAGCNVHCGAVSGDIDAGGSVTIRTGK